MDNFKFEESPSVQDQKNTAEIDGVINLNESKDVNQKVGTINKKPETKPYTSVDSKNQFTVSTLDEPVSTTLVNSLNKYIKEKRLVSSLHKVEICNYTLSTKTVRASQP